MRIFLLVSMLLGGTGGAVNLSQLKSEDICPSIGFKGEFPLINDSEVLYSYFLLGGQIRSLNDKLAEAGFGDSGTCKYILMFSATAWISSIRGWTDIKSNMEILFAKQPENSNMIGSFIVHNAYISGAISESKEIEEIQFETYNVFDAMLTVFFNDWKQAHP